MRVYNFLKNNLGISIELKGTSMILEERPDFDTNRWLYGLVREGRIHLTLRQAKNLLKSLSEKIKESEKSYARK